MPSILAVPTKIWGGWLLLLAAARSMVGAGAGTAWTSFGTDVAAGLAVGDGAAAATVADGVFVAAGTGSGAVVAVGAGVLVGAVTSGTAVGTVVASGAESDPHAAIKKTANDNNIANTYCLFTLYPSRLNFPVSQYLNSN
jgi:hypothetical protein